MIFLFLSIYGITLGVKKHSYYGSEKLDKDKTMHKE